MPTLIRSCMDNKFKERKRIWWWYSFLPSTQNRDATLLISSWSCTLKTCVCFTRSRLKRGVAPSPLLKVTVGFVWDCTKDNGPHTNLTTANAITWLTIVRKKKPWIYSISLSSVTCYMCLLFCMLSSATSSPPSISLPILKFWGFSLFEPWLGLWRLMLTTKVELRIHHHSNAVYCIFALTKIFGHEILFLFGFPLMGFALFGYLHGFSLDLNLESVSLWCGPY